MNVDVHNSVVSCGTSKANVPWANLMYYASTHQCLVLIY